MSSYVDMETSFIENATMKRRFYENSTEVMKYRISPVEGYVLHDKRLDEIVMDEDGNETGEIRPGFRPYPNYVSVGGNYDFDINEYEFYCVPADSIDEDQLNK